ncbi:hypothetical protein ACWFRM_42875, partial [Streptomyces sp. NPDC055144]
LPASVASVEETAPTARVDPGTERWLRVELRAETLDWLPPVLASLDRPFVIERPDELRNLVTALADRLASCARQAGSRPVRRVGGRRGSRQAGRVEEVDLHDGVDGEFPSREKAPRTSSCVGTATGSSVTAYPNGRTF